MKKTILSIDRVTRLAVLFCLVCLVNGCQNPDQQTPVAATTWHPAVDHFAGSLQSGPQPHQTVQIDPNTSARITVTWVGLTHSPTDLLSPIEPHIQRIVTLPKAKLVQPVVKLTHHARFDPIDDKAAFLSALTNVPSKPGRILGVSTGVLPMDVCGQFTITPTETLSAQTKLQISRPSAQTLQIALVTTAHTPAESGRASQLNEITEMVILDPVTISSTAQFALLLPCPSPEGPITTLAALIEVDLPGQFTVEQDLLTLLKANLGKASPGIQTAAQSSLWKSLQEAIGNLYEPVLWRRSLLFLATMTEAALAQEITLAGDWQLARQLATDIAVAVQDKEPNSVPELGWEIEYSAYALLLTKAEEEQSTPAIASWLMLHAGQLGRDPTTLRELINIHNSVPELQKALIKENKLYLLDMSPAARTRAYEWLKTQGETVNGYDPLASAKDRRKALETTQEYYD